MAQKRAEVCWIEGKTTEKAQKQREERVESAPNVLNGGKKLPKGTKTEGRASRERAKSAVWRKKASKRHKNRRKGEQKAS